MESKFPLAWDCKKKSNHLRRSGPSGTQYGDKICSGRPCVLLLLDEKKHTTEHILRSLIDPSKDIDDKYRSQTFVLSSGKVVTGMVMEETSETIRVVVSTIL